eukprot:scaffold26123_cov22-Phaeocystis_antarctica.AAC.1
MPASLALLPRPVGGHLPTRGASLLGPTRTRAREAAPHTPGQGAALLGPTSPRRCRCEEGQSRFRPCPPFFTPSWRGGPIAYSA